MLIIYVHKWMGERATESIATAQTATILNWIRSTLCVLQLCELCAVLWLSFDWSGVSKMLQEMNACVCLCLCLWESTASDAGVTCIYATAAASPTAAPKILNLTLMPCKRFSLYDSFHFIRCVQSMAITIPGCIDIIYKNAFILRSVSLGARKPFARVPFFLSFRSWCCWCCCCCHAFIFHLFCKIVNWLCTPWLSATRFHRCLIFIISYYCYSVHFQRLFWMAVCVWVCSNVILLSTKTTTTPAAATVTTTLHVPMQRNNATHRAIWIHCTIAALLHKHTHLKIDAVSKVCFFRCFLVASKSEKRKKSKKHHTFLFIHALHVCIYSNNS